MAVPSTPLFGNPTKVTGDAIIKGSPGKLWAVQLNGGTDASSMLFHNDVDSAGGTDLYSIVAPSKVANNSEQNTAFVSLVELGGIDFDTGIYVDWTGTAAVGWVWFS